MTAFEYCGGGTDQSFTIGKSKVQWEAASYRDGCDKVRISRIIEATEDKKGKPFLMGLRYCSRYISPDTIIKLVEEND